jgi:hypothetical protein
MPPCKICKQNVYNNRAVSRTAAEIIQTYLTPRAALFVRFPVVGLFFFHVMRKKTLNRFNQQNLEKRKTYEVIRALHNLFISWTSLRGTVFIVQSQFSPDNGTLLGRSKISHRFKWTERLSIKRTSAVGPLAGYVSAYQTFSDWPSRRAPRLRLIKMRHVHATLWFQRIPI